MPPTSRHLPTYLIASPAIGFTYLYPDPDAWTLQQKQRNAAEQPTGPSEGGPRRVVEVSYGEQHQPKLDSVTSHG